MTESVQIVAVYATRLHGSPLAHRPGVSRKSLPNMDRLANDIDNGQGSRKSCMSWVGQFERGRFVAQESVKARLTIVQGYPPSRSLLNPLSSLSFTAREV